jgi:hypothetical protein
MKIIAIIPASEATDAILDHLRIDTHNPAPGRGVGPSGLAAKEASPDSIACPNSRRWPRAEHFVGWWDGELEVNRRFRSAEDGELRCLPDVSNRSSTPIFVDPACSQQAYSTSISSVVPSLVTHALDSNPTSADARFAVHRVGQSLTYYSNSESSGECLLRSTEDPCLYHRIDEKVDADQFVAGMELRSQRTTMLDAIVLVAEDGASTIVQGGRTTTYQASRFPQASFLQFVRRALATDLCSSRRLQTSRALRFAEIISRSGKAMTAVRCT